jgi:hypothetical protein
VSVKPARETTTTTDFVPEFVTRTAARALPSSTRRAGAAVRTTGGRASAIAALATTAPIIGR